MKIVFKRSGGFAPNVIGCVLDSDRMPPEKAQQMRDLVRLSDIMTAQTQVSKSARDAHTFSFQIENDEGETHSVQFDTISLPDAIRPLMEFCREQSSSLISDDI